MRKKQRDDQTLCDSAFNEEAPYSIADVIAVLPLFSDFVFFFFISCAAPIVACFHNAVEESICRDDVKRRMRHKEGKRGKNNSTFS